MSGFIVFYASNLINKSKENVVKENPSLLRLDQGQ